MRVLTLGVALASAVSAGSALAVVRNTAPAPSILSSGSAPAPIAACEPVSFRIYFERDRAELTGPAESTLDLVSSQIRGCRIEAVAIGADAEDVQSQDGRRLAGLRGAAVLAGLTTRGVAPAAIVIAERPDRDDAGSPAPEHLQVSIDPKSVAAPAPAPRAELPARQKGDI